ncbi:MAG: Rrf2 family transcriptional regulator [Ignavibacteriaceae bacterium]|nr:Rrf2 family transcriptional regulator [Ignavibacteriaceae bacterium]
MLKLSKKTEYALMAVKFMARNAADGSVTAKEISEGYNIPYDLLSKVLQQLTHKKLVNSFQGIKGGYTLNHDPENVTLFDIISAVEPNYQITDCFQEGSTEKDCTYINCCMIRDPLAKVQKEIDKLFKAVTIQQILWP